MSRGKDWRDGLCLDARPRLGTAPARQRGTWAGARSCFIPGYSNQQNLPYPRVQYQQVRPFPRVQYQLLMWGQQPDRERQVEPLRGSRTSDSVSKVPNPEKKRRRKALEIVSLRYLALVGFDQEGHSSRPLAHPIEV